jgi:microcin C transport system permease protein
VERVFSIDGLGMLGYEAIVARDYPVVLGILVVESSLRLGISLVSDLLVAVLDPRVRFE